ncbi:MAG: TonB-dependent receptor [Parahaliea sp.]
MLAKNLGFKKMLLTTSLPTALLGAWAPASFAQLEEVIVTAQKRQESLQDTPISMVVLGAADLENQGITSVADLGDGAIPNVRIATFSGTPSSFFVSIRGIAPQDPSQISAESPAGVYIDGVYLGRAAGLAADLLDIERAEVLRGPQGTLFGRNSLGGAIALVAKKPTGEFGFRQTLSMGRYDYFNSVTRVDLPEFMGISTKIDYIANERDGWVDNSLGGEQDWYQEQNEGGRIALLWQGLDRLSVEYAFDRSRSEATNAYFQLDSLTDGAPPFPAGGVQQLEPDRVKNARMASYLGPSVTKVDGHTLNISWDATENHTIRLISAYRKMDQTKQDNWDGSIYRPGPLTRNTFGRVSFATVEQNQLSHELQWIGTVGEVDFVAGAYYFRERAEDGQSSGMANLMTEDGPALLPRPQPRPIPSRGARLEVDSNALFGQATWRPSALDGRLAMTLGLRYTDDDKEGERTAPAPKPFSFSDDRVDPSVTLAYDLTEEVNTYLKWGTAYRGGGVNTRSVDFEPYESDEVETWEIGLKSELFDRRMRFNAAVFHTVWEGQQIDMSFTDFSNPGAPSVTETINALKDVTYTGFEFDTTLMPARGVTINANYGYLDVDYPLQPNPFSGERERFGPIFAPRHSASVNAEYEFEPTSFGILRAYVGLRYSGGYLTWGATTDGVTDIQREWDARLTLDEIPLGNNRGNLKVALWGKNLDDQSYINYWVKTLTDAPLIQSNLTTYNTPRTYGIDVTYTS